MTIGFARCSHLLLLAIRILEYITETKVRYWAVSARALINTEAAG